MLLLALALSLSTTPPPVMEVGVGRHLSCARTMAGDVYCWGLGQRRPTRIDGLTQIVDLSVGEAHVCAVRDDGAVLCWGNNEHGQLGDGTTTGRAAPALAIGVTGAVEVAVDRFHSCARRASGEVYCWGGAYETGAKAPRLTPAIMRGLRGAVAITAGGDATCARKNDQTTWCWGFNGTGLFLAIPGPILRPRRVEWLDGLDELALGNQHGCVRLQNLPAKKGRPERRSDGVTFCFGDDTRGALGDQFVPDSAFCTVSASVVTCRWTPLPPPSEPIDPRHPRPDVWPPPERPPIAPETRTFPARRWPVAADAMHVRGLVASAYRTCGIANGGTVECWGDSFEQPPWSHRRRSAVAGTDGARSVAISDYHGCGVFAVGPAQPGEVGGGSVRCWGQNEQGALGDGTTVSRASAEPASWE